MKITGIRPHPTIDYLEIAYIRAQVVVPKGQFKVNDSVKLTQVKSEVEGIDCDGLICKKREET